MYKINLTGVKNTNDYEELIRMFVPGSEYELVDDESADIQIPADLLKNDEQKDDIKRYLYEQLNKKTGKSLKWGTLTGVKPLKLYDKLVMVNNNDRQLVHGILKQDYLVDDSKIKLLEEIHNVQSETMDLPASGDVSLYIGIPFCPTRCTYCSFTSNQKDYEEIERYLDALYLEMEYVSSEMKRYGMSAETVYIGGGTPTTLEPEDLKKLVRKVKNEFPLKDEFEFTVEAGRPDTITREKMEVLKDNGVDRISINPQTMNEKTLELIGRDHDIGSVEKAFELALDMGFKEVNTDLIAGLPGEQKEDFVNTVEQIIKYDPKNVTVHTLALKKSSKLMDAFYDKGESPRNDSESTAEDMVLYAKEFLHEKGYRPYYIYRQKYMADNLENVGYAKKGTECKYNIRIMEEKQTILAMGAGGSSKVFFPEEDRLERVMNVNNYELYIDRINEMIARKHKIFYK